MRTLLVSLVWMAALLVAGNAAPKSKRPEPPSSPSVFPANEQPGVIEFQADDLSLALRTLARQAGMNIAIAADVQDTVTLRLENKTAKEAIQIIAKAKDLLVDERQGVSFIGNRVPKPVDAKSKNTDFNEATLEGLVPLMTKFFDTLLDYEARPATVQKLAKAKKAMFDALMAEGFTREEAFKLLLAEPGLSFFGMRR